MTEKEKILIEIRTVKLSLESMTPLEKMMITGRELTPLLTRLGELTFEEFEANFVRK